MAYHCHQDKTLITGYLECDGLSADKEKDTAMTTMLQESLLGPDTKPALIDDCLALIEHEVSVMSGMSGIAVKLAYKTVNKFAAGHVRHMVGSLMPKMAEELEPYWTDFGAAGGADFGDYLAQRGPDVSQSLLSVTDARAAASGRPTITRAYGSVRGSAGRHVEAALPQVGALVQKHAR